MGFSGVLPDGTALLRTRKRTSGAAGSTLSSFDLARQELRILWPLERRDQVIAMLGNDYVACAPDRGSQRPEVNVYRLRDGKKIRTIQGHTDKAISARFSSDGSWLATWQLRGPVKLWKIPIDTP